MSLKLASRWQYNAQKGLEDSVLQVDAAIEQAQQLRRLAEALLRQLYQGKYSNAVGTASSIGSLGRNIAIKVECTKAYLRGMSEIVEEGAALPAPSNKSRPELE